jgi:hypothetical protein
VSRLSIGAALAAMCGTTAWSCGSAPAPTAPAVIAPSAVFLTVLDVPTSAGPGFATQLTVVAGLSDGTLTHVTSLATWHSSDATVASISASGLLTTVAVGQTTVRADYQSVSATVSVVVVPCTYGVSPVSHQFIIGNTTNFFVIAPTGCAWTVQSNATWLSVAICSGPTVSCGNLIAATSSSGFGQVIVGLINDPDVSFNRTGTVTIAGQTITLTENGGAPAPD